MQAPYLNFDFFNLVHNYKDALCPVIFFAELEGNKIAGSLCFQSKDTLYGRHWGSSINIDSLHFECCYYQGIEYCIKNGISFLILAFKENIKLGEVLSQEPLTSYHYVLKEDFRNAIKSFVKKKKLA